jgi:hypothetical protein
MWSFAQRVGFRWFLIYSTLYLLPFPLSSVSLQETVDAAWTGLWARIATPVGESLFGVAATQHPTGSGDTGLSYVMLFLFASVATLGTAVWSVVQRHAPHHRRLAAAHLIYVRFALGTILLSYGVVKVWKTQFPLPSAAMLMTPAGAFPSGDFLWAFMGVSTAYSVFTGVIEMLAGTLLYFRRTALVGAVLGAGVMANVAMLNLAYDVPVKQFSLHLLGFALYIAAPHAVRLGRALLGMAVPADPTPPESRHMRIAGAVAALVLFSMQVYDGIRLYYRFGDGAPRLADEAAYDVVELAVDGKVIPPRLDEPGRWRRVGIEHGRMSTLTVDDTLERFGLDRGAPGEPITLTEHHSSTSYRLTLSTRPDGLLELAGVFRGKPLRATLRKLEAAAYPLLADDFRWIRE